MLQAREGGAGVEVGAGQGVELHCHSQGGRPPAEIHWWDSDTGSKLVADMRGGYIYNTIQYNIVHSTLLSIFMQHSCSLVPVLDSSGVNI